MKDLDELKQMVEDIQITYDLEKTYNELYNACIDYMNDTQNWDFEYIFEDIIDYDTAEEIAKGEIDRGGLIRLYYFLGDANLNNSLFRIDGYGNLTDLDMGDLEDLKIEILEQINYLREEGK